MREMLISHDGLETRVAILEDRRLAELYIERPRASVAGNVYLGKVTDVLPGMQAAFVDIGLEKNAYLSVDDVLSPDGESVARSDIRRALHVGQSVLVQVAKDPMGTKGARITMNVSLPGRHLVLTPFARFVGVSKKLPDDERARLHDIVTAIVPPELGVIVRTVASGASESEIVSDLEFLLRLWRRVRHQADEALPPEIVYAEMDLALRIVRDAFSDEYRALRIDDVATHDKVVSFLRKGAPSLVRRVHLHKDKRSLFDTYSLGSAMDEALSRTVELPSGGHVTFDRTEAMTVVDVNTGRFVGKSSFEDTLLRTNIEAADEIARQLRLRDIGGIVVIDFIDMESQANRDALMQRLGERLKRDRTKTRLGDMSRLGLVELTRKNVSDGLYEAVTDTCPCCSGDGRVVSPASRRIHVERRVREIVREGKSSAYLIAVAPDTYRLLTEPGVNLTASIRAESGRLLRLVPQDDLGPMEARVLIEGRLPLSEGR